MKRSTTSWQDRISAALELGTFISWREEYGFIDGAEGVQEDLMELAKRRPREALKYFEIFLAGCLAKGGEVDDSGGSFGMFIERLFQAWARCCFASKMEPAEFIRKIAHWIKVDSVGFCYDLEETIVPALNPQYRAAFREALEKRLEKRAASSDSESAFQYRSALAALKKLLISTRSTTAIIEGGERYGFTQEDCLAVATILDSRKQAEKALEWIDRGLKCDGARVDRRYELENLKRKLMVKTGRRGDAIQDAWKKFEGCPSIHYLEEVLECASRSGKAELIGKAVAVLENADIQNAVEAFHELGKTEELARRIDRAKDAELRQVFYSVAVSAARSLARKFPLQAARLYSAQALAILDERKSRAYHHAHDYLHETRTLFQRVGRGDSWLNLVEGIRREHRLKSGFMPAFEKIVAGCGPIRPQSFMEQISNKLDRGRA